MIQIASDRSRTDSLVNQTLGKFDLVRELGRGSMGAVYLGHDAFADQEVAIKVAHSHHLQDPRQGMRYRKMFFHEAKVAARLRHPNIVQVFDVGVSGETCYIVMEYVPGAQTLHNHTRSNALLPMEDVVRIMFECAKALDDAHRNGVIHRDIKPRNILLTAQREVKIGDFSIALMFGADATVTQLHGYVGSPLYMSPEQVREETLSNQSDIFSLGVVLYELLCGKHPFHGDNLPSIISKITTLEHIPVIERRREVPMALCRIVDCCLRKSPAQRYRSGLELAADLARVFPDILVLEEESSGRDRFRAVSTLTFFEDFPETEIWEVINASSWHEYEAGCEIITEGEIDSSFYVIVDGEVDVMKGEQLMGKLVAGDCFGEMGFIAGRQRSASIVAGIAVSAIKVRASLIDQTSLQCQLRFHKIFLKTLVERLSSTTARVSTT